MFHRVIWALLPACTFATELPENGAGTDGGPTPTPSTRCLASGLAVCIDFEDMPDPMDGVQPRATITSTMVTVRDRLQEKAAELKAMSEIKIDDASKLDIPRNLTIEMWTMPTQVPPNTGDKRFGLFDTHLQYQMSYEDDEDIECRIQDLTTSYDTVDSAVKLTRGMWHHVACTYDGSTLKVYVNGRLEGCQSTSRTVANIGTFGAAVGANMGLNRTYRNHFVGQVDNVHLYNRTLGGDEICALWGNGNCSSECPSSSGSSDE